jgi:hypothetical protein
MKVVLKTLVPSEMKGNIKKPIKYNGKQHELAHNGVFMRKNRLSTVLTVDIRGFILEIAGKNPTNLKIGNCIYDQ